MVLTWTFRGFVAPVFTPFTNDDQLNLTEITKYARHLWNKKVAAVLVNGTVGEGVLMSTEERMKLTESWMNVVKTTGQQVMVHIGGTNLNNVVQLAKHAEFIGVPAILCLPDPFFKPANVDDLVNYLKIVSAAAPKTPLFYYHYPSLNGVHLDMIRFLENGFEQIPTLAGLKYTHTDLCESVRCVQFRQRTFTIFLGRDELISAALFIGFDSMIPTCMNFAATEVYELRDKVNCGDIERAVVIQERLWDLANFVNDEMEWINGYKAVIEVIAGIELGNPRPPLKSLTLEQRRKLKTKLILKNWIL